MPYPDMKLILIPITIRHKNLFPIRIFFFSSENEADPENANAKKTLFEKHFDNEFREIFKKESYITFL